MDDNQQQKDFQQLFDAASKVLEATYAGERSARQAVQALSHTRDLVERRLNELSGDVSRSIEGLAEQTAERAAGLLHKKFEQADEAAHRAAERYTRAAQGLVWKLVALALVVQATILLGVWLLVENTIPSLQDIGARRQEVAQLEQQVIALERRGGRLELGTCLDNRKHSHICFRTNEASGVFQRQGDNKTYRIPWGN